MLDLWRQGTGIRILMDITFVFNDGRNSVREGLIDYETTRGVIKHFMV